MLLSRPPSLTLLFGKCETVSVECKLTKNGAEKSISKVVMSVTDKIPPKPSSFTDTVLSKRHISKLTYQKHITDD